MFNHIIASYVDDNIPYTSSSNLGAVIIKLEKSTNTLHQWYRSNIMTANNDNSHILVTGDYEASANINEFETEISKKKQKTIGNRLSF